MRERERDRGEKEIMEKEKEGKRNCTPGGVDISVLPEECTSNIVSLTSPKDACTACAVSPIFRAAAESNVAWDRFSPSERKVVKVLNGSFFKGFPFMDFGFVGLLTRVLFDFFEKNVG